MRTANSKSALDRKLMKKKYRLGVGYIVFYAILLAGISMGLYFFLSVSAGSVTVAIPGFLFTSLNGFLYTFSFVSLISFTVFLTLFPGSFQFTGLTDNSWNLLEKFGVDIRGLILNKLRIGILSRLAIYLLGFFFSFLLGFLLSSDRSIDIRLILSLFLVGLLPVLMMVTCCVAIGAITKGKLFLRLSILGVAAIAGYLLYYNGYHICTELADLQTSTTLLISANPLGLVIIAAVFAIVFPILTFTAARARVAQYNTEELDDDTLVQLGIRDNMLVLERGRTKYTVAISGPSIHNTDFDIPVPPLDEADKSDNWEPSSDDTASERDKKSKREKRLRNTSKEDADDPNTAPVDFGQAFASDAAGAGEQPESPAALEKEDEELPSAPRRKKGGLFSRRKKDDDWEEDPLAQYEDPLDDE